MATLLLLEQLHGPEDQDLISRQTDNHDHDDLSNLQSGRGTARRADDRLCVGNARVVHHAGDDKALLYSC